MRAKHEAKDRRRLPGALLAGLGARLRRWRRSKYPAVTQEALAAVCAVQKQAVSHWEKGRHPPDVYSIYQLWNEYRLPPSWLLVGEGPDPVATALAHKIAAMRPEKRAVLEEMLLPPPAPDAPGPVTVGRPKR